MNRYLMILVVALGASGVLYAADLVRGDEKARPDAVLSFHDMGAGVALVGW